MKISVKVKTNARKESVIKAGDAYTVSVTVLPEEGKANEAVIKLLAKHFAVAPSLVRVVSGHTAKQKIVEIIV